MRLNQKATDAFFAAIDMLDEVNDALREWSFHRFAWWVSSRVQWPIRRYDRERITFEPKSGVEISIPIESAMEKDNAEAAWHEFLRCFEQVMGKLAAAKGN